MMEAARAMLNQPIKRPLIMGIMNMTPDSFSDGGQYNTLDAALLRAEELLQQGADILDIGAESTRPGSEAVSDEQQIERIEELVRRIHELKPDCVMSVDTTSSRVAEVALDAGASMINDISAGRFDEKMFSVIAERGVPYALMHMQGTPKTMQNSPHYEDVVTDVEEFLVGRCQAAINAGIRGDQLIVDPGIGFGKRREDNLALLQQLDRFVKMGYPVLLGTSRKRFMGAICDQNDPQKLGPATIATTALGVRAGVVIFRVHDVADNRQAADVSAAIYPYPI